LRKVRAIAAQKSAAQMSHHRLNHKINHNVLTSVDRLLLLLLPPGIHSNSQFLDAAEVRRKEPSFKE
jgi:hypothetical protein